MADIQIFIDPHGVTRFVHSDEAVRLTEGLGQRYIKRASHVEPNENQEWIVDLSPLGGGILGPFPAHEKQKALDAEVEWVNNHFAHID